MISVFSNYLSPLIEAKKYNLTEPTKPSEVYIQLRIAYNQGVEGILDTTRLVAPISENMDNYDIIEEIWRNKELRNVVRWINKKMTLELDILDYRTLDVRIRIATNMLNKLVYENKLSKDLAIRIHCYFVSILKQEISRIWQEDLPFLP